MLAAAVVGGRRAAVVVALILGLADVLARGRVNQATLTGTVLMLLAGLAVGHLSRLAVTAQERLREATELTARTRERERLAREIHDSVLQVLAMVQRRGAHLDGEAGALARLAGEQEVALRSLMNPPPRLSTSDSADLRELLRPYGSAAVTISAPASMVVLPEPAAREVVAAVGAALDNVVRHAGAGARAWVLVEEEPQGVRVTVRDDGVGFPPGRLDTAAAQGRLGVAQSIRGRLRDLGGSVLLSSRPGEGTEVELWLPRTDSTGGRR